MLGDDTIAFGPDAVAAAAVVILIHGRGRTPSEMRQLAETLGLPSVRFVIPAAPGGTWYPQSFLAPFAANEPVLSESLATYARTIYGLIAEGVPVEKLVLAGFSQGACLTAEVLLRNPRRYGAAIILTGGFIGPPGTTWPLQPALKGVPIYITGSRTDDWVPADRTEETARVLRDSGADVRLRIFGARAHTVSEEELGTMRVMIENLVAGRL